MAELVWRGGYVAGALVLFVAACTHEPKVTEDEDDNGTTTTSTSTTTSSTSTTSTSTTTSPSCLSCLDYVDAALANQPFDTSMMCGYVASGDPAPGSSYGLLRALGACVCDPTLGGCDAECVLTCTGSGVDTEPACGDCQQAAAFGACSAEFNACSADTMGTRD